MKTTEEFFSAARAAIQLFDQWAAQANPPARADHLCYKCGSTEEFRSLRSLLEPLTDFLYQSPVAGRPIAILKFTSPLPSALGPIFFLELSDQKPDGSQLSGFEHIEIYPRTGSAEALATALGPAFKKIERPHHVTFDAKIDGPFLVRIENEPLVEKVRREEMGSG